MDSKSEKSIASTTFTKTTKKKDSQQKSSFGFLEQQNLVKVKVEEKQIDIPLQSFEINEGISKITLSRSHMIILSSKNNLYKWKFGSNFIIQLQFPKVSEGEAILQNINPFKAISNLVSPKKYKDSNLIKKLFTDLLGIHTIISLVSGDNFYYNKTEDKLRILPKIKGYNITDIAFEDITTLKSTNDMLIGTLQGELLLYKINFEKENIHAKQDIEEDCQILFSFPNEQIYSVKSIELHMNLITGCQHEGKNKNHEHHKETQITSNKQQLILIATQHALYYFSGQYKQYSNCFEDAKNNLKNQILIAEDNEEFSQNQQTKRINSKKKQKQNELEQEESIPILTMFFQKLYLDIPSSHLIPQSFAYTSNKSYYSKLYYFQIFKYPIKKKKNTQKLQFLNQQTILKTNFKDQIASFRATKLINVALTELHYLLLYKSHLLVCSGLQQSIIHIIDFNSNFKYAYIQDLLIDQKKNICIYSQKNVFIYSIENEPADIWYQLIQENKIKDSFNICQRYNLESFQYVSKLYADIILLKKDSTFKSAKLASKLYSNTSINVEAICVSYLRQNKWQWFKHFLIQKLNLYNQKESKKQDNEQQQEKQDKMENLNIDLIKNLIADFQIYELILLHFNKNLIQDSIIQQNIQNEPISVTKVSKSKELFVKGQANVQNFMSSQKINQQFIQNLSNAYGANEIIPQNIFSLENLIEQRKYNQALEQLQQKMNSLNEEEQILEYQQLLNKYIPILLRNLEFPTLYFLLNLKNFIEYNPEPIIYDLHISSKFLKKAKIILDFLLKSIKKTKCNQNVYNLLFHILSNKNFRNELEKFFETQYEIFLSNGQVDFKLDQCLFIFKNAHQIVGQILLLGLMQQFEKAIEISITENELEIAIKVLKLQKCKFAQKQLLLQIIKELFKHDKIEIIKKILHDFDSTAFTDIFQFIQNDNISIKTFYDSIGGQINQFSTQINEMKNKTFYQVYQQLKIPYESIKNRSNYLEIEENQRCDLCFKDLVIQKFVGFPCYHYFHSVIILFANQII